MTVKTNTINLVVPESFAGMRLDLVLAKLLPDYSRSHLKQWILKKYVSLNGKPPIRPRDVVKASDCIQINIPIDDLEKEQQATKKCDIKLAIVHEDDDILVINKPSRLVVHPGAGNHSNTLTDALLQHLPLLTSLPRAGLIHRLDKDTSGLLVVAKTIKSHVFLTRALQNREVQRKYLAVVNGVLTGGGTINASIGRHKIQRTKMAVYEESDNETRIRKAITHYRVIERFAAHTLVEVTLETGRTHQIRVHLAHLGYPIIGDATYGGRNRLPKGASFEIIEELTKWKRQALHAYSLSFAHPKSEKQLCFTSKIPEDMEKLINCLRNQNLK